MKLKYKDPIEIEEAGAVSDGGSLVISFLDQEKELYWVTLDRSFTVSQENYFLCDRIDGYLDRDDEIRLKESIEAFTEICSFSEDHDNIKSIFKSYKRKKIVEWNFITNGLSLIYPRFDRSNQLALKPL